MNKRNYTIELFRFLFAIILVNHHFFHVNEAITDFYFLHGNNGVEFFFLVSGYLMASSAAKLLRSQDRPEIGSASISFVLRKVKTVIVPVYCAWIFAFAVAHICTNAFSIKTILYDLLRSPFELLFLRNAGFTTGYYCINQIWYISAMLLTMLACYPLLLKFKKTYLYCVAPLLAIFVLGFLNHEYTSIVNTQKFVGVVYKTQLRSLGVINLGIVCYAVAEKLRTVKLKKAGIAALSVIEILCYTIAIGYTCGAGFENHDFLSTMMMAGAILISFSQRTWLRMFADRIPAVCTKLGKFSLYIYLSHVCICRYVVPILKEYIASGAGVYVVGMLIILALTFVVMFLTSWVRYHLLPWLKCVLVAQVNN